MSAQSAPSTREQDCAAALELHADRLFGLPNVCGVGIVDDVAGDSESGCVVAVYVVKRVAVADLAPSEIVPRRLATPDGDVRTRVIERGGM